MKWVYEVSIGECDLEWAIARGKFDISDYLMEKGLTFNDTSVRRIVRLCGHYYYIERAYKRYPELISLDKILSAAKTPRYMTRHPCHMVHVR